ncbi:hypothetical protein EVJ58_g2613 [Rhodofomes roseus]|uniref:Aminoglycoside phosphotransferase domain-containing protein n=1 Tax=Rhodofomes roseus TaxID=34475 RepID=A0A4Y9YRQ9_9APHY|nr:hypothetical protein EVJ58_g2613 [Rhodofomes roseus]
MGGQNYHLEVSFTDGISWLCRVQRQNAESPPLEIRNRVLLSEAATLQFLSTTSVPVPRVYDVLPQGPGNEVGAGYMLVEKVDGHPLDWYSLDDAGKRKVLKQFATIQAELAKHPLPAIGCLKQPGSVQIGPLVHERMARKRESGELILLGPFKSALDMYTAFAKRQIENILNEELYVDNPTTPLLVYQYLLDIMPAILPKRPGDDGEFYVKHMDDKGDHIFVDETLNIVSLIDWEWAQTIPKELAFCAPLFLLDVGEFYDDNIDLSPDEALLISALQTSKSEDLAICVRNGRIYHRLVFCLEENVENEETYAPLLCGLRKMIGLSEHDNPSDWAAWKKKAELTYAHDRDFRALQRHLEKSGRRRTGTIDS